MQKLLVTAALALGLSSTAFANTGNIQFKGAITSGTCSIEIIDPVTGGKMDNVRMGNVASGRFNTIGDEGLLQQLLVPTPKRPAVQHAVVAPALLDDLQFAGRLTL